mgnify:CR=1 FL=1
MKRLIDAIITKWFTVPEWELENVTHCYQTDILGNIVKHPYKTIHLYKCKKTGKFKTVEI